MLLRALSLSVLFSLIPAQAAVHFAHNVSESGGFVNTKKYWDGDDKLCWAATTSNMLQWWQNNSTGIPDSVPNGINDSGRTKIYDTFCNNWQNKGLGIDIGLRWYLGGKPLNPNNYLYDFKIPLLTPKKPDNTGKAILRHWDLLLPPGREVVHSSAASIIRLTDLLSNWDQILFHSLVTGVWWG